MYVEPGREPERNSGSDIAHQPQPAAEDTTLNQPLVISPADKILAKLAIGSTDIPRELYEQAGPELATRFTFTVLKYDDGEGATLMAVITPRGLGEDESKKSYNAVKILCPDAKYVDDCVLGLWQFPKELDTAEKIAAHLSRIGFAFDAENQDPKVLSPNIAPAAGEGDLTGKVISGARKVAGGAAEFLGDSLESAGKFLRGTLRAADAAIDRLGRKPETEVSNAQKALDIALSLLPFVEPTKEYASARIKYREGIEKNDQALVQDARRDCLMVLAGLGIDVLTLGSAGATTRAGQLISKAIKGFSFLRRAANAADNSNDPLGPVVDRALQEPLVVRAMDELLSMKAPEEPRGEGGEGSSGK